MKRSIKTAGVVIAIYVAYSLFHNISWYKADIGESNCGPTCVAMAIKWATGQNFNDIQLRGEIGYSSPGAGTTIGELATLLRRHEAEYEIKFIRSAEELSYWADGVHRIAIVGLVTGGIDENKNPLSGKGRTYGGTGNHWVVIVRQLGYYYEVQDPISGGRDRYYEVDQVWRSMIGRQILLVSRSF